MARRLFGVCAVALTMTFGMVLAEEITALVTGVSTKDKTITYKEVTNPGKDQTVGDKEITVKYDEKVKVTAGGGGGRGGKGGKGGKGGAPPETGGISLLEDKLAKAKDAGRGGVTATLVREDKSKPVTEVTIRGGGRRGGGGDQ